MAADGSSPEEAMIAARRARSLIDKYQLADSDFIEKGSFGKFSVWGGREKIPLWESSISIDVARLNDCRTAVDYKGRIIFKGFSEDAEVSKFMFIYIRDNGIRACKRHMKESQGQGNRNSFKLGYAFAIRDKVAEILKDREFQGGGKELMVIKNQLITQEYGAESYRNTSVNLKNGISEEAGRREGKKVNITTGLTTHNHEKIL